MNKQHLPQLKKILEQPKKICIIPHFNPDGDAMGSTLALYHLLKKLNHQVHLIAPNVFPDFLAWLPASDEVKIFENQPEETTKHIEEADVIFTLDFNALHRTGEQLSALLEQQNKAFVMIDHHQMPDNYAELTFSEPTYGSTCELLHDIIDALGYTSKIDQTIATCLYTGIVTDSGSFKFSSTTANTHRVVANLIDCGVKNAEVHQNLFDNSSENRLRILGRALENLKTFPEYRTAYITLSQQELDELNYKKGDTEGIVNYGLSIQGIEFAAIFIENAQDNLIKISFRSQGAFDVNQFARKHFQGGGHLNAAGGKSLLSMQETIKKFETIIKETHP